VHRFAPRQLVTGARASEIGSVTAVLLPSQADEFSLIVEAYQVIDNPDVIVRDRLP
jgi:hypothetical protein